MPTKDEIEAAVEAYNKPRPDHMTESQRMARGLGAAEGIRSRVKMAAKQKKELEKWKRYNT